VGCAFVCFSELTTPSRIDAINWDATGTNDGSMCPSDVRICSANWACSNTIFINSPVGGVPAAPPDRVSRLGAFLSDSEGGNGGGPSNRDGRVIASRSVGEPGIGYIFLPLGPCELPDFLPTPLPPLANVWPPFLVAIELDGDPPTILPRDDLS
jgi:hypothetical protein